MKTLINSDYIDSLRRKFETEYSKQDIENVTMANLQKSMSFTTTVLGSQDSIISEFSFPKFSLKLWAYISKPLQYNTFTYLFAIIVNDEVISILEPTTTRDTTVIEKIMNEISTFN